jgi:hypothetical protein
MGKQFKVKEDVQLTLHHVDGHGVGNDGNEYPIVTAVVYGEGDTVDADTLAPYQLEAIEAGEHPADLLEAVEVKASSRQSKAADKDDAK